MAPGSPTEGYGRGMRQTRRSQRAKEADLNLTGLQISPQPGTSDDLPITHNPFSPVPNSKATPNDPTTAIASLDDNAKSLDPTAAAQTLFDRLYPQSTQIDAMSQQVIPSIEDAHKTHDSNAPNAFELTTDNVGALAQPRKASSHTPIKQEQPDHRPRKIADPAQRQRVTKPQKSRKKKVSDWKASNRGAV